MYKNTVKMLPSTLPKAFLVLKLELILFIRDLMRIPVIKNGAPYIIIGFWDPFE